MPLYSDFGLYYSPHLSTTPSYYSSPFLGTTGRSSGLGLFPAPRVIPRVSPVLPSIPETSSYSSSRHRTSALDRYIPLPSSQSRYKPLRIDTADIDVSSHRYGSSSHGPSTPERDNTIKRGRTVVRLHTKKCKESPVMETRRRMTPGEKLMQKFLILDKAEEEAKAARRKRLEEQEIRERAEAEVARLQALAAAKGEVVNTPESDSTSVADASPQNFPTVGGITENAALDILLSATEDEEQVSGGEISRSSSSGTIKRRKSKGTVKATKKKSKKRKSSLVEGDETDSPNGNGEDPVCSLQRRNTVRFRRNSQDTDAFPEVDLTAGSRRSSFDQSLPGSRRSSLDSSTGDEIPLANQKKGTVKRRKEPPHRIAVADASVDNGSSNGPLNSPKSIVEDVNVDQSCAPKMFRYEVIVEDVEGERVAPKQKDPKGDIDGKKKKKVSDSDTASSESEGIAVPNIKDAVSQSKGEKKDSKMKSFQKSQAPLEVATAAERLNARKTEESKINFKSKEDSENLPLGIVGKEDNGTNKNEKEVKQMNEKNNKLNQKNVGDNKFIPQTITTQKNAQPGDKQKIQNDEKNNVLEKKQPKRQADPSPVEDSPKKESNESVFNFWDELKPDEENKEQTKSTLPKKESSLPDTSAATKNRRNTDGEKVTEPPEQKPIPKWKEKLQGDKNTVSNKIEESKQKSGISENKKQTNNQKGFVSNSKVEALVKDSKLADKKGKQENEVVADPIRAKKEKVNEEKSAAFSASTLDKEYISSDKNGKDKTNNIVRSGKSEEEMSSKNESPQLTKTDQKIPDKVKRKTALPDDQSTKQTPSATEQVSVELMGTKSNESTEKNRDNKNSSKEVTSLNKIPALKDVTQELSLTLNDNLSSNKKLESSETPTKKMFTNRKEEQNVSSSDKSATGTLVGVQKTQDDLSKDEVKSQKPPFVKRFVNQKSNEDLPEGESGKPTAGKQLAGQKNKEISPNEEISSLIATKKVVGQKSTETSPKDQTVTFPISKKIVGEDSKKDESTIKKLVTQKSKESSSKDESSLLVSAKILVGQKSKEDPPKDEPPKPNATKILVGQKSKGDESDKPVMLEKFVGQKDKENEATTPSTQKKLVGPKNKEESPKDGATTPNTAKKLVGQKCKDESGTPTTTRTLGGQMNREGASKDETVSPNITKKLVGQKSKEDVSVTPAAPKKLVGQKSKENELATPNTAKKFVEQKSKEEDESAKPAAPKKLVEQKSKEDESAKPAPPKKLVGQKSKEETAKPAAPRKLVGQKSKEDESATPNSAKKLVGQKSKEDESAKPAAPKKLVGLKNKEDESAKSADPKKLVEQKSKEDESAKPAAPKKLVGQKSKQDESAKPAAPNKLFGLKRKEDESAKLAPKNLVGQKGKQVSPVEPDTQTSSPAGGKKIVGKAKIDVAETSDKTATAKRGIKTKEDTKPVSGGTKVGAKVLPSPDTESHGSDADSEESSSDDEDSTPRNSSSTNSSGSSGSTSSSSGSSSSDSGFDSRPSSVPVSSTASEASGSREPGSPAPSAYSATLDPYSEDAGLLQSGSIASGRTTPPATSLPRFRKYTVDDFQFLKLLGKGTFGKVLLAELRGTDRYYAVKCLKKDVVLEDDDVECTLIERKVLALGTKHPYLCHLFCTFQTESHLLFVMEYLNGGDLMFHIQQSSRFPEPRARFYAAEIVCGLKFLHKKGIVYRDLKLDNILLDYEGHVRIADFGMCKLQIFLDRTADTFCGTPDYMAPEIVKGLKYNQCVDWWSFGVLTFEMLVGVSPFSGCDEDELFWSICNEQPQYPRFLSREAHSLLASLLEKDSLKRLGTPESPKGDVPDHVFFRSIDWGALERRELEPPFRPRVKYPLDVQYFDTAFTAERPELTPVDASILQSMDQAQFHGFSYTNPNATD